MKYLQTPKQKQISRFRGFKRFLSADAHVACVWISGDVERETVAQTAVVKYSLISTVRCISLSLS